MKNYSEIRDIKQHLDVEIVITGSLEYSLLINNKASATNFIHPLLEPLCFSVIVKNKDYNINSTGLVTIESLIVDEIDLIPRFNHLTTYENDRAIGLQTNCLGFNGTWQLNIEQPFYQWLHQVTGQGWLLQPTG